MAVIGDLDGLNAANGNPAGPVSVVVGDLIQIFIPIANVAVGTIPTASATGLQQVGATILDNLNFSAFFVVQQAGSATATFSYMPAGGGAAIVVNFSFNIETQRPGRMIQVSGSGTSGTIGLTDIATGQPPVGGVIVGDMLFYQVGSANLLDNVSAGASGGALQFSALVDVANTITAYFSAVAAGSGSFTISYGTVNGGDGGFISPSIHVNL